MIKSFLKYTLSFISIAVVCVACDTGVPAHEAATRVEEEPLLLPYKPMRNGYYPLYYQRSESERIWNIMEQPIMSDVHAPNPLLQDSIPPHLIP